jgi:hypothetical protein
MELKKISELPIREIASIDAYVPIIDKNGGDFDNHRMSLLNLFKSGGIINVNRTYGDNIYTLQTALALVEPTLLTNGVFITFKSGVNEWQLFQRQGDTYVKYLNKIDTELNSESLNPVTNTAISNALNELAQAIFEGGSTLWEIGEGDILSPLNNRTFTLKKAYEINPETGDTTKRLNEQGDFTPVQITDIPTLSDTLTRLEDNTPLHTKRYLTSEEFVINGITYYKSVYTKPDEPLYTIEKAVTGTSIETATTVATFVGFPALNKEITLPMQDIAVIVEVRKTGAKTCNLFAVFGELRADYSIVTYGTSGIRVIGTTATTEILYIPIAGHIAPIGASSMLEIKGYSSGGGSSNTVYVDVQNHTGSRFSYVVGVEGTKSHPALTDKNAEPEFQHVDTTANTETFDKVVVVDADGNVIVTDKANVGGGSTGLTLLQTNNNNFQVDFSYDLHYNIIPVDSTGGVPFVCVNCPTTNKEFVYTVKNNRTTLLQAALPSAPIIQGGITYNFIRTTATTTVGISTLLTAEFNFLFIKTSDTTFDVRVAVQKFV